MSRFEIVSKYKNNNINLPSRATKYSAGYDIEAAIDIVVPSLLNTILKNKEYLNIDIFNIEGHAAKLKNKGLKATMVPTGIKVELAPNEELEIRSRSSLSTKNLIFLANGVGTIDMDYYENETNEGEIHIPLVNLSPFDLFIKKGDKIAQALIKTYRITEDDAADGVRIGGFGSTNDVKD